MTPSELKLQVERHGKEPYFFTRKTMAFFGDTMKNYGVTETKINTLWDKAVPAYELFRRRPVRHGLQSSAYFCKTTFKRLFTDKGEG